MSPITLSKVSRVLELSKYLCLNLPIQTLNIYLVVPENRMAEIDVDWRMGTEVANTYRPWIIGCTGHWQMDLVWGLLHTHTPPCNQLGDLPYPGPEQREAERKSRDYLVTCKVDTPSPSFHSHQHDICKLELSANRQKPILGPPNHTLRFLANYLATFVVRASCCIEHAYTTTPSSHDTVRISDRF